MQEREAKHVAIVLCASENAFGSVDDENTPSADSVSVKVQFAPQCAGGEEVPRNTMPYDRAEKTER